MNLFSLFIIIALGFLELTIVIGGYQLWNDVKEDSWYWKLMPLPFVLFFVVLALIIRISENIT